MSIVTRTLLILGGTFAAFFILLALMQGPVK